MTEITRQLDTYHNSFEEAQEQFSNQIKIKKNALKQVSRGTGLDVVMDGPTDALGFRKIEVDARDLPNTPQLLGRVILLEDTQNATMHPAVIMPKGVGEDRITISRLKQAFTPKAGLTPGLHFGVSVQAQTQAPSFGGHTEAGGFEGGHFGVAMTTARSAKNATDLVKRGDSASHKILAPGLPTVLNQLGMFDFAPPDTIELDARTYPPGARLPLFWHPTLESEDGAVLANYPDATKLLLGAGLHAIGRQGLDQVGNFVEHAVKGK